MILSGSVAAHHAASGEFQRCEGVQSKHAQGLTLLQWSLWRTGTRDKSLLLDLRVLFADALA